MKRWEVKTGELVTVTWIRDDEAEAIIVFAESDSFRADEGSAMSFFCRHAEDPKIVGVCYWTGWRQELVFTLIPASTIVKLRKRFKV